MTRRILTAAVSVLMPLAMLNAQKMVSPEIHEDHSVTFRLKARKADKVVLKGSFIPKPNPIATPAGVFGKDGEYVMTKEKGNVWTYTTDSLESELYTYYFEVDGERMLDPQNPDTVRDVADFHNRFVVLGGRADDYVEHDVAHGCVDKVWYESSLPGLPRRRMTVYTPPSYDAAGDPLPVLYLLHGSGGDETSWVQIGKAAQILDNLIDQQRCKPMIVVMPNGIVNRAAAPGEDPYNTTPATGVNVESMFGTMEKTFVGEIVKYIDEHYNTVSDKKHRAIAGLSLGGLHTLFISLNNPDEFDYVGLFSAQATNTMTYKKVNSVGKVAQGLGDIAAAIPYLNKMKLGGKVGEIMGAMNDGDLDIYDNLEEKLKRQFKTPPSLYYIALGRDDFVKKLNDDFRKKLDAGKYKYVYNETDGGHCWENWRRYLVDFLPRLFNEGM